MCMCGYICSVIMGTGQSLTRDEIFNQFSILDIQAVSSLNTELAF